jgi:cytochrome P450
MARNLTGRVAVEDFDPLDPEQNEHPFPWLSVARRDAPVFYMPRYRMWAVTRYEDCLAVLRDSSSFSNVGAMDIRIPAPASISAGLRDGHRFPIASSSVTVLDPPEHTPGRKAIQPALGPKQINALKTEVRDIADRLIDRFAADGEVELMGAFAFALPIEVFAPLLGISVEQAWQALKWVADWFRVVGSTDASEAEALRYWTGLVEWEAWAQELMADRRRRPGDDLISQLVGAAGADGGPALSDDEIVGNLCNLIAGGVDTTAYLIGQAVYELLRNDLWETVQADRALVAAAVEETMRLLGPVRSVRRRATRDVEIGGVTIPQGAELWIVLHSANRDERAFDDPDTFDVRRTRRSESSFGHLGFGNGVHFCVGAPLARLEARLAVEALMDRLPGLDLAPGLQEPRHALSLVLPGLESLDLVWPTP